MSSTMLSVFLIWKKKETSFTSQPPTHPLTHSQCESPALLQSPVSIHISMIKPRKSQVCQNKPEKDEWALKTNNRVTSHNPRDPRQAKTSLSRYLHYITLSVKSALRDNAPGRYLGRHANTLPDCRVGPSSPVQSTFPLLSTCSEWVGELPVQSGPTQPASQKQEKKKRSCHAMHMWEVANI